VKILRELASLVLGAAVGACLYSLLKLKPLSSAHVSTDSTQVGAKQRSNTLRPPWVQRASPSPIRAKAGGPSHQPVHARPTVITSAPPLMQPAPETASVAEPTAPKEVSAASSTPSPPVPKAFKTMGYVEKAGGQLEAIILQENQMQVVHIGDLIAERYRVTQVSPEEVATVDVTQLQPPIPMANGTTGNELAGNILTRPSVEAVAPGPSASPLGYVEKADGKVESVVADGDTVRLVPETSAVTMAQLAPVAPPPAAVPAQQPALPTAAAPAVVEAVVEQSASPSGLPALLPSSIRQEASNLVTPQPSGAEIPAPAQNGPGPGSEKAVTVSDDSTPPTATDGERASIPSIDSGKLTATIKPLGFVTEADGQLVAILPDGEGVSIVRQGDRFGGHLRALSVTPDAVLAVEEPPPRRTPAIPSLTQPDFWAQTGTAFVFQTLGTVQDEDGELQAIVADGSERYLVKQGDTFANRYRVTSVDSFLVLAVKATPAGAPEDLLLAQTESGGQLASKKGNGKTHYPLADLANGQALQEVGESGNPGLAGLDVNLLTSTVTGFSLWTQFPDSR